MPRWTPEAREKQRQLIQTWQPWQHSTGPRTEHGLEMSSRNNPYLREEAQFSAEESQAIRKFKRRKLSRSRGISDRDLALLSLLLGGRR